MDTRNESIARIAAGIFVMAFMIVAFTTPLPHDLALATPSLLTPEVFATLLCLLSGVPGSLLALSGIISLYKNYKAKKEMKERLVSREDFEALKTKIREQLDRPQSKPNVKRSHGSTDILGPTDILGTTNDILCFLCCFMFLTNVSRA
jgi:Mg2+/Co2+ transporter CorB